jgi:hypothetical protein
MTSFGIIPEYVTVPAHSNPATVPGCPVGRVTGLGAGTRSCVVSETPYGAYTAIPIGPRDTLVHQIMIGGRCGGYVHFDLVTYKWAVSTQLHGTRHKIQWSHMSHAVEMVQFIAQSAKDPYMYAAAR